MNAICRVFVILQAVATVFSSCSTKDFHGIWEYEYDTEWAAAYYYGEPMSSDISSYKLLLVAGRTDENASLVSCGAMLSLSLNAPTSGAALLPEGEYGSSADGLTYTFEGGKQTDSDAIAGSFVGIRAAGAGSTKFHPVEDGWITVEIDEEGEYEIDAFVVAGEHGYSFEYSGRIDTYDCTLL